MSQCLRCNELCAETAIFCDNCRNFLLNRQAKRKKSSQLFSSPVRAKYSSPLEQTNIRRLPFHASALETAKDQSPTISSFPPSAIPDSDRDVDLSQLMPDAWPGLEDMHESVSDGWLKQVDPLMARQLPARSAGMDNSEEAKIVSDPSLTEEVTSPLPSSCRKTVSTRLRLSFAILIVIIVLALIVDAILITVNSARSHSLSNSTSPLLTVTPEIAFPGQLVLLHISHFSPFAHVFITRDIQEIVRTDTNSPLIPLDAAGSANIHILIEKFWTTGMHTIEGEDVVTRYTASTTIQILGAGPPVSPHLILDKNTLDMGADLQGANTITPFTLHNTGGASVSWVVSSNQPWLMTTPTYGVFSESQSISVAVTRSNLAADKDYQGTLTFTSNVDAPVTIHIKMKVLALPARPEAVLEVTPPALAFAAMDGGAAPADQILTIGNPGSQPLAWSYAGSSPIVSFSQAISPQVDANWLNVATTSGVVAPGSSEQIHVQVWSYNLLEGVYSDLLTFNTASGGLNNPQHVAVSVTVGPGTATPPPTDQSTNAVSFATTTPTMTTPTSSPTVSPAVPILGTIMPNLSFTYTQGQTIPANQFVTIANIGGSAFSWQASISPEASSWLNIALSRGNIAANQSNQIGISVNPGQLIPGSYSTQVTVRAIDSTGAQIQNSPQVLTVSLLVYAACSLQVTPANLAFSTTLLNPISSSQSLTFNEVGNCNHLVLWRASGDQSWLIFSTTNGTGNGSLSVHANSQGMLLGNYTAQIRLAAVDSERHIIAVSPSTISVILRVNAT